MKWQCHQQEQIHQQQWSNQHLRQQMHHHNQNLQQHQQWSRQTRYQQQQAGPQINRYNQNTPAQPQHQHQQVPNNTHQTAQAPKPTTQNIPQRTQGPMQTPASTQHVPQPQKPPPSTKLLYQTQQKTQAVRISPIIEDLNTTKATPIEKDQPANNATCLRRPSAKLLLPDLSQCSPINANHFLDLRPRLTTWRLWPSYPSTSKASHQT